MRCGNRLVLLAVLAVLPWPPGGGATADERPEAVAGPVESPARAETRHEPPAARIRAQARDALARLAGERGMEALSVTWPQSRLVPRRVSGIEWSANGTARKIAERFVEEYSDLLGAPRGELAWSRDEKSKGRTAVHFRQEWKGIRVSSGSVVIVVSDEGKVLSCSSGVRPVLVPPPEADIGPEAARLAAVGSMGDAAELAKAAPVVTGKLLLVSPDRSQVVYRVLLPTIPTLAKLVVLVDAATGRVVQTLNDVRR